MRATKRTTVPAPEPASAAVDGVLDAIASPPQTATGDLSGLATFRVDPRLLLVDENPRVSADPDDELLDSVRANGVLVPLLLRRDPTGGLLVVDGRRRLNAAIATDQTTVPVALLDEADTEAERLLDQLIANHARQGLTAGEEAAAYHKLVLFGVPVEVIARRTRSSLEVVSTALRVADSPAARQIATAVPAADLTALAAVADLDESPELVERLEAAAVADPGKFRHELQKVLDEHAQARCRQEAIDALPAGTQVLAATDSPKIKRLYELATKKGAPEFTPETHAQCPGHAAFVSVLFVWSDAGTKREPVAKVTWYCADWKKQDHFDRWAITSSSRPSSAEKSDEEREAAKLERRALIANNKAADTAVPVRRQFVTELLARKVLPKDAAVFVAGVIVNRFASFDADVRTLASTLAYGDANRPPDLATPDKALRWLVALAAAAVENDMPRDFWHKRNSWAGGVRALYLHQLEAWGYTLADVEALAVKTHGTRKKG